MYKTLVTVGLGHYLDNHWIIAAMTQLHCAFSENVPLSHHQWAKVPSIPKNNNGIFRFSVVSYCLSMSEREGHSQKAFAIWASQGFRFSLMQLRFQKQILKGSDETNIAHSVALDMQIILAACRSLQTPNKQKSFYI